MDSALRQRMLKMLDFDFAARDLNEAGVRAWRGHRFIITGPEQWPIVRAWWTGEPGG